ncbi:alpha/beta hydrolase [Amycolatopsis cihanbeyliensis]|uniref:Tripeptidyl-peptidase B n=1 Tax=Amycolatopsis cihanbeyliensis TaxID=1128664 RepID=A0A542DPT4_AMYCI|nr:alpha/beta hydrolase [Amycolatopsis cihanbeyliensis]TQJ04975.1 tripeptidyl-peptidase B [Amycolatopsis cihanbeyliensis]
MTCVLAACSSPSSAPTDTSPPPTTAESVASSAPTTRAPLDRYYEQNLEWGPCAPFATSADSTAAFRIEGVECARLRVPLDYAEPGGEEITLGLLRHRAGNPDARIGSLVLNPGGPGASGMVAAAGIGVQARKGALAQRFDLVGFDPRGVGASRPQVECLTDAQRDADRADDGETDGSPRGVAEQEAEARDFIAGCVRHTEHGERMLANLGTRDVVKDMDVLRSALGDEKLSYVGYSYGTRIGYTYAEAFPSRVRAMVLDGAVDPEQDALESTLAQVAGFGVAFGEFVDWCVQRQDCALGSDPAGATGAYQDLVRPLIDNPIEVGDGRRLSYEDATTGTIQALYAEQFWEKLNTGLAEVRQGSGKTLMELADRYNQRDENGHYASTQDAFTAINCVDHPKITDKDAILAAQREMAKSAPFLDDGRPDGAALDACAFWPVPSTSEPGLPRVDGVPSPLVVSTTNDPATPYEAGVNLARAMDGALVTFEGTQHTVFLQGNECVDGAGTAYLVDGTLPAEGTRCAP